MLMFGGAVALAQTSAPPSPDQPAVNGEKIDWDRARDLLQRSNRGEKLALDDQAFLDRAKEVHQKMSGQAKGPGTRPDQAHLPPPRDSTGMIPLTQLKGDQKYKDQTGGLYGDGRNDPPPPLQKAAAAAASAIVPLDAAGQPDPEHGVVVLMSMGMSNTTMEFALFKRNADVDPQKSPKLVIVDGAQGGMEGARWANPVAGPKGKDAWAVADDRIHDTSVTPQQIQVLFIKQALGNPAQYGDFPAHADALRDRVITALGMAKKRYPNLKLAFLSSRIYGGYASTPLNPEPYAYEGAFGMRGVIQAQLKGDPKLNFDPAQGEVKAPVVLWGPYLWADGVKAREGDNLVYTRQDLSSADGTHPSPSGQKKVADLLLQFFKTNPYAKGWFTQP